MATRMQQRRGTAAQWISTNSGNGPILSAGEIGFESDTNKFKIGDGINHWVDLTYFTDAESITTALNSIIDGAPAALNTLNELAAALGDDANFLASLATESYVDTAVLNSEVDQSTLAGAGLDWTGTQFSVDTATVFANPTISSGLTLDGTGDFTISADANIILDATTEVYIGSAASGNEVATKAYADAAAAAIVDAAPGTLNTLNELAAAINDDASYATTITTALGTKAPLESPTFTGTVKVPSTVTSGSAVITLPSTTSTLATTQDLESYAPLLQTTTTPSFTTNNYTLVSGDKDKIILASNGSTAGTITIPTGTFSIGTVLTIVQTGSGQLTITSIGTLNSNGAKYKLNGQWASCQVIVTETNTFLLIGNLAA